ncbi:MAG: hypothetical protein NTW87_01395 [Planctomycetota bacterium]|nr:hypothetical protein [Planctomycetota bacterium]
MTLALRRFSPGWFVSAALIGICCGIPGPNARASEGFLDLVRLAQAGADTDDMVVFLRGAPGRFVLSDSEKTNLLDLGVDEKVFVAIDEHNRTVAQTEPVYVVQSAAPADELQWDAEAALPEGDTVDQDVFYRTLSPYGTWFEADGQWVWRPMAATVDAHWRPYCHRGHWVTTEHGWTWYSDYSWGWAPFHYGRWHRHAVHGWVWTPGLDWGPAWVVWRPGSSDCGWAPMPPAAVFRSGVGVVYTGRDAEWGLVARDFVFVALTKLFEPRWWESRHPRDEKIALYGRQPMAHTHVEIVNNILINRGLEISVVERVTGRPVPRYELARFAGRPGEHVRPASFEGNKFLLYRPAVRATINHLPVAIQEARAERIKHYEIAHDQRLAKAQSEQRVRAQERQGVFAKELEAVAERHKQHEAEAEVRRVRDQKLTHEAELKRIGVVRAETEAGPQRELVRKAEEDRKRQLAEAKTREAQATREAEQRRKETQAAEQKHAADAIQVQRRAQEDQRRKQEAQVAADKQRLKDLDEQRNRAAEAKQRAALEQQQAEQRKQMEAQRASQAQATKAAEEQRKAFEVEAKARLNANRQADEQRVRNEKALEDAQRKAASRAAERERQAIRDDRTPVAGRKGR